MMQPRSIAAADSRVLRFAGSFDCLIASIAIRSSAPVLHQDSDFDILARHTELRIHDYNS